LAQVPWTEAKLNYDLGCGPSNSTDLLVKAYPGARMIGVDNSYAMLAKARVALPKIEFEEGDLARWNGGQGADLAFSNATFQWVPGHLGVLHRQLSGLPRGGVLAVQMPDKIGQSCRVWR
jgi:trans-aconitate 2-methyltransferase